jgi:cell division septation protein DedD
VADDQSTKGRKMTSAVTAFDPVSAALQQLHHAVANEEVPEDFLRILGEIDAKIAAVKSEPVKSEPVNSEPVGSESVKSGQTG